MKSNHHAYQIIAMTQPALSAEEKYLLLRVGHLYGSDVVNRPVAELEAVIGLSDGVLKRARDALVGKGLLSEEAGVAMEAPPDKHPGGRPPKAFRLSDRYLSLLHGEPVAAKPKPMEMDEAKEKVQEERRKRKQKQLEERNLITASLVHRMSTSSHQGAITSLLFWGAQEGAGSGLTPRTGAQKKGRQLSPRYGTRLLLAILYGLADRNGVVRGLGLGQLARLAGMKRESLGYQLGKLAEAGFLRAHVPGVTGQFAYGLAAGNFFLDPRHQSMPQPIPELLVCWEDVRFLHNHHPLQVGLQIHRKAGASKASSLGERTDQGAVPEKAEDAEEDDKAKINLVREWLLNKEQKPQAASPKPVMHADSLMKGSSSLALDSLWKVGQLDRVFQGGNLELARYLQSKVEGYASGLLSEYWDCIDKGGLIPEDLLHRIQQEILPERVSLSGWSGLRPPAVMPDALALYVYIVALRMACELKDLLLSELPETDWQGMKPIQARFAVLPLPDLAGTMPGPFRMAISIVPRDSGVLFSSRTISLSRERLRWRLKNQGKAEPTNGEGAVSQGYWLQAPGIKEGLKYRPRESQESPSLDADGPSDA